MLKVLQVINSLSSGGAEVFVSQLSVALSEKCDIKVLTYAGELDEKGEYLKRYLLENGVQYTSLNKKNKFKRLLVPFRFAYEIIKWKPDIIHVHLDRCEQFIYFANLFCLRKIIAVRTKHNSRGFSDNFINKLLNGFYVKNIACSNASLTPLIESGLKDKTVLIENGIDVSCCQHLNSADKDLLRLKLGLPKNKIILLHIGSMHGEIATSPKAHDIILKALSLYKNNNNYDVIFLGGGDNLNNLKHLASNLELENIVSFKGIVPNVQDYLNCADIFILPSRWEGLPISAIEAACSGLPMILSDIAPFTEFESKSVTKCDVDSPESLANSINLMVSNLDDFKNHALNALDKNKSKYSIKSVAEKHIALYQSLL